MVNRLRPTLGWTERDIVGMVEGFARLAGVHFVPDDRATADRALTTGTSASEHEESELAEALVAVTDALVPAPPPRRRPLRRRLLARRG